MARRKTPELDAYVGARIRRLRKERGLTMMQLVEASGGGVSQPAISALENGRASPTVATLSAIAEALGLSVADLVANPDQDTRQWIFDHIRGWSAGELRALAQVVREGPPEPRSTRRTSRVRRKRRPPQKSETG
ncbi:MAG TPA: helix-turn-helix transcriptional regulator [Polyangiaceae bacterium LLY-WYZ-15_(1-7)]|nr:helix-turn-helix transcriptional regulator [Polyangiaceae bacterium LLY-WYZ-15_(1-7)]HJL02402.1 helix-turn-helix transcriptional regulator [Polyangiaceae bacterium LLY-WYZ-15_(1-7)]HJL11692.1 helix-turn-helix transcriptional regulator [Polyangiaceae bacterium LLY-WYZ-15_(1-7)]HJL25820.1 helix-turn-helix transcriptional regulator [Polyangiaceae bacterium LLY-WYZ-15_(1-7)]HJL33462.1 helix-turn-helix transcriptional regulator [Polyangiaceae bacterium LLY-WYZ-15_(1-7)]